MVENHGSTSVQQHGSAWLFLLSEGTKAHNRDRINTGKRMLRWCATHWRPASIFLRLCTRNDFASPSVTLLRALSNPTATTPITPSSIPSSILLLFPTIVCYYARYYSAPYYDSFNLLPIFINFVFFLFFWISFIQDLVWFIDFQFLIFSSSYSFPYPGNTLSGRSVLCTVSDKNIRSLDQQRDLRLFGNFSLKFLRVRRV